MILCMFVGLMNSCTYMQIYICTYNDYIVGSTVLHFICLFVQESSQDERGAAALHAVQLDDRYGGAPVQVRVVQSKEPDHFLLVFKGRMVVHSGGRASGFKNRFEEDSYDVDGTRLFHVRGTNEFDTRAVQVEEVASSLNSNDCFVLETPPATYIWYGKVRLHTHRHRHTHNTQHMYPSWSAKPVQQTEL